MRDAFVDTATALLDEDPRTALVLADISAAAFAPAARRHPDRVLNVGIREQLHGRRGRRARADRAAADRAPLRAVPGRAGVRADQAGPRPPGRGRGAGQRRRVVRRVGGGPHPPVARRTWRCSTRCDGWTVHVPGHPDEVPPLLRDAAASDDPVYLRLSAQRNAGAYRGRRRAAGGPATPGRARRCVVAVGPMLDPALAAVDGLDVTVAYTHTPRPFDTAGLRALAGDATWSWSSRTWPARRPGGRPRRWPTCRTGCSRSAWVGRTCAATASGRGPRPLARAGRRRPAPLGRRFLTRRVPAGCTG